MVVLIKNIPREAEIHLRRTIRQLAEDQGIQTELSITDLGDAGMRLQLDPVTNLLGRDERGRFQTTASFLASGALKTLQRYYPDLEMEKAT